MPKDQFEQYGGQWTVLLLSSLDCTFGAVGQVVDHNANQSSQDLRGHPRTTPCTLQFRNTFRQIIESKQAVATQSCVDVYFVCFLFFFSLIITQTRWLLTKKIYPVIHVDREQRLDGINIFVVPLSLKALTFSSAQLNIQSYQLC